MLSKEEVKEEKEVEASSVLRSRKEGGRKRGQVRR